MIAEACRFLSDRDWSRCCKWPGYYRSFGRIATVRDVELTKVYDDEPVLRTEGA